MSQYTPFRGTGAYGGKPAVRGGTGAAGGSFPQAEEEARRVDEFFDFFETPDVRRMLRGKAVLDLGCGYGGRTVKYATEYGAASVVGVEVFESVVTLAGEYAAQQGARNCTFRLATQTSVGLPSESVDVVVSYDVLEHVQDPRVTLAEIHRVLRPSGTALLVFTPYHGMLSHHLGYITRIPGIHWIFSPQALVAAINSLLASKNGRAFDTALQPAPAPAYNGRRICLPSLNGLTGSEFRGLLSGFEILEMRQTPLFERYHVGGRVGARLNELAMSFGDWARDAFSFNLSCILRKK